MKTYDYLSKKRANMTGKVLLVGQDLKVKSWLQEICTDKEYSWDSAQFFDDVPSLIARNEYTWVVLYGNHMAEDLARNLKNIAPLRPYTRFILLTNDPENFPQVPARYRPSVFFMKVPDSLRHLRENFDDAVASFVEDAWQEDYDQMINHARRSIQEGRYDEAYGLVTEGLKRDPSRPDALNLLGILHETLLDRKEALRYYRAALSLDPGYEPARLNLDRAVKGVMPHEPVC